jgi:hypothetical protein
MFILMPSFVRGTTHRRRAMKIKTHVKAGGFIGKFDNHLISPG